jgi:hypothetical protein
LTVELPPAGDKKRGFGGIRAFATVWRQEARLLTVELLSVDNEEPRRKH